MLAVTAGPPAVAEPARPFLAYHASWYEPDATRAQETTLVRLPGYITHVALSFAKPDLTYGGGLDLTGTGLEYRPSGAVMKDAIALLKARHPGTRVLLALGGSTYSGWDRLAPDSIGRLVRDLGADGVDIDFEPPAPGCAPRVETVICATDAMIVDVVRRLRKELPRPYVISMAGWSVGAYGAGDFANAPPASPWRGLLLGLFASAAARDLDLVSIMSYDAGPAYDATQAFRAYRSVWKGPLALGIAVMPSGHGDGRFTVERTARLLHAVAGDPLAGAMLYALLEVPPGPPGPDNPDYRALSVAICVSLELPGCDAPLP
ncbi:glycoside hydrolase family 18 protein [Ancylobacter sp. VNQ12]|uniref:glycoside hydrolase family 18 protein n=1 Tax=Ancylobacter sp. VNQ12 TaxID=3400920 RepID=UPI003C067594